MYKNKITRFIYSTPLIIWIIALAFIIRLPFTFRPLKGDEILTLQGIRVSFWEIIPYLSNPANHEPYPPLFYWIFHIWDSIFANFILDRFLLVLIGTTGVYFTYRTGTILKNKELGIIAAILMVFTPQAIWADQWLRAYSLAALLCVLTVFTYLHALKTKSFWIWISYSLFGVLLLYNFYFGAIILIALGLHFIFFVKKNRRKFIFWIIAQALIFVSFAPWLSTVFSQFKGSSGVSEIIEKKGLWLWNLHIGALLNGWLGTFGLDSLWNPVPVSDLPIIYLLIFFFFICGIIYLSIRGWIASLHDDRDLTVSVLWISIVPAFIGFVIHQITSFPVVHHYYSIICWSGAIALALAILKLQGSYRFALIGLLVIIYSWRIADLYFFL